ncbi:MAG: DUF4959 domain-containing protein [Bacteroidetes bacterium]|nr:DUF4959 domain-containing protein [Bacteroidota bacterium]
MTSKIFSLLALGLLLMQWACKKSDYNEITSTDKTKPGVVTNIKVVNFNGGAYLTYNLPDSKNILYVQANYKINDKTSRQTKSSYYSDSITVSGFADSKDYQVVLYTVSRAEVKSDSVVVTVHPKTPPYKLVYASLLLQSDFGGVNIKATDTTGTAVGIITLLPDPVNNKYVIQDQHYTADPAISYSLRGYDTIPKKFGLYVTDQWGNVSDTLYQTVSPIFETQLGKSAFQPYVLATDVPNYQNGLFNLTNLWDNNLGEFCYNTQQPILPTAAKPNIWPAWMTFDMGQTAKLSRYVVWDRVGGSNEFVWNSGAPQTWIMWGRADVPQDELMPTDTTQLPALGAKTPNGWVNLGVFNAPPKPAHNPLTNADIAVWQSGFSFDFSIDLPKVRYIRFECLQTMGGTNNYFNMNEMSVYGNPF